MTLVAVENPSRQLHLSGELLKKHDALATRLGPALTPIRTALQSLIDSDRIHTSSWIPGADWTGTPYQAIYEVCGRDPDEAAKAFGLIVWKVFEDDERSWASAHGMKDGAEIRGRTYFLWPAPEESSS